MLLPKRFKLFYTSSISIIAVVCCGTPAFAQIPGDEGDEIVVTAERIRGSVETDVPPVEEIDEKDIASYGAGSIADIVAAVAPQSGSGRGRGGGMPIILLNSQRISGFRELRDLPPEAIKRVQIFPEEVALQYGFRPDQRVINFILKDNFASASASIEAQLPEDGGFSSQEFENNITRIGAKTRLNIDVEYEQQNMLTENERNIIANPASTTFEYDGDVSEFRSLLPDTERFEINGNWSRSLAPQTNLSLNANYQLEGSSRLLGLPAASLLVPGTSPFSLTGNDVTINRYFDTPRALEQESEAHTAKFGFSFNTLLAGWRMALTGDYARVNSSVKTTRNADFTNLRAGVLAGTLDPYASDFGSDLLFQAADTTDSLNQSLAVANTFSGHLFQLPAGPVQMTLRTGFNRETLSSASIRSNIFSTTDLRRNNVNGAVNIELPLVERDIGTLGFLGELSINGNYGLSELSDFGRLTEYGTGLRWSPVKGVTLQALVIGDENAPSISQLGSPVLVTPNTAFFDFTRNETVFVDLISGGNAALVGEKRRDFKLSLNVSPAKINRLNLQVEYYRNNSHNTSSSFPILTPEIEAAYPGRVVRDAGGQLISVDKRPVNFDQEKSQSIRWGFNFSGSLGREQQRAEGGDRRQAGPAGPESGPAGRFGRPPSRWQIALYHTWRFEDKVVIRPGVPELDLLNGSATSAQGGSPHNELELSGGLFANGFGMRVNGNYRGATRVNGSGMAGSSDLKFSDLATLNLRFFINLDDRGNLTKKIPILKGSRIAISLDNALNDFTVVQDQSGIVPLSYQRGYLDPRGRLFEIDFRKRF